MKKKIVVAAALLTLIMSASAYGAYYCTNPETMGAQQADGTFTVENGIRFVGTDGQVYVNHWLYDKTGYWYYFDANGCAVTGFQNIEGKNRYFEKTGQMGVGNFAVDGQLYFTNLDGEIRTNETISRNGITYTVDSEGKASTPDGIFDALCTQIVGQSLGTWTRDGAGYGYNSWQYYLDGQPLVNTWLEDHGHWFYLGSDGFALNDGVAEIDGKKYYFNDFGDLLTSTMKRVKDKEMTEYTVGEGGALSPVN